MGMGIKKIEHTGIALTSENGTEREY